MSVLEITALAAAYIPISGKIRHIYRKALGDYQIELSQSFCRNWRVWVGAQYTYSHGHSLSCDNCIRATTNLQMAPVSIRLKYHYYVAPCTAIYLGAGPCYSFLRIHDHWPFVHQHISKGNVGGLFKLGAKHYFSRLFFAEVFADYLLQRFHFSKSHSEKHFV